MNVYRKKLELIDEIKLNSIKIKFLFVNNISKNNKE